MCHHSCHHRQINEIMNGRVMFAVINFICFCFVYVPFRYNFGFFTIFWDWVFGTLKHPEKGNENWKAPKRD